MPVLHQITTCLQFQTASEKDLIAEYDYQCRKAKKPSFGNALVSVFMLAFRLKEKVEGEIEIAGRTYVFSAEPKV